MKERLCINFCISFIYLWFTRIIYFNKVFFLKECYNQMLFCLVVSIIVTILLEAVHYLIMDIVKYTKLLVILLIALSIGIVYITTSKYLGIVLGYIDFMIIRDLLTTYQVNHLLEEYKK